MRKIILFDGICNFCNRTVHIILAHDLKAKFQFASNQSQAAIEMMDQMWLDANLLNSVVLVEGNLIYTKTDAIIKISIDLYGWPRFFRLLKFIPKPIRDFFYDSFARNRYRLFGKRSICMIPDHKFKDRFLD